VEQTERGILINRNVLIMLRAVGVTFRDTGNMKISPCSQRAFNLMGESVLVQSSANNKASGLKRMV